MRSSRRKRTWVTAKRRTGIVLVALGLVLVLIPLGRLAHARIYYELVARGIVVLDSESALDPSFEPTIPGSAPGPAPAPGPDPDPGASEPGGSPSEPCETQEPAPAPVWRIYIPKIRVARTLVDGVSREVLKQGPGVYPQGARPGEPGNLAIAGHRNAYGSPFWFLDRLVAGDGIYIAVGETTYVYLVERSFVVEPTEWSVIAPTSYDAITLTTCHPLGSTSHRLIVRGRLDRVLEHNAPATPR